MARPNNAGSPLIRQKWTDETIVGSEGESYFNAYMNGTASDSPTKGNVAPVVYQVKSRTNMGGEGHIFNITGVGELSDAVIEGDATGIGKGEKLRVFSSQMKANRFRKVVQTDTGYDRQGIGLEKYLDQQGMKQSLSAFYAKWYDQYIFDCLQGVAQRSLGESNEFRATHVLRFPYESSAAKFGYDEFQTIQRVVSEGTGFTQGGRRKPLRKAKMMNGEKMWVLFIDPAVRDIINRDSGWQTVLSRADVRGKDNQLLAPVFANLNRIAIVEMPRYFGETTASGAVGWHSGISGQNIGFKRDQVKVEECGMRQYDDNGYWTGQSQFDSSGELWSRALLCGMQACQVGYSMRPKIGVFENEIDDLVDLSLHVAMAAQKTKWDPEARGDYDDGKVTNLDYNVIPIDIQVGA